MWGALAVLTFARGAGASCGAGRRGARHPRDGGGHVSVACAFGVCTHRGSADVLQDRAHFLPACLPPAPSLSLDPPPWEAWESRRGTVVWEGRVQPAGERWAPSLHTEREQVFSETRPARCRSCGFLCT